MLRIHISVKDQIFDNKVSYFCIKSKRRKIDLGIILIQWGSEEFMSINYYVSSGIKMVPFLSDQSPWVIGAFPFLQK
jgi:hypothetical protein